MLDSHLLRLQNSQSRWYIQVQASECLNNQTCYIHCKNIKNNFWSIKFHQSSFHTYLIIGFARTSSVFSDLGRFSFKLDSTTVPVNQHFPYATELAVVRLPQYSLLHQQVLVVPYYSNVINTTTIAFSPTLFSTLDFYELNF